MSIVIKKISGFKNLTLCLYLQRMAFDCHEVHRRGIAKD